MASESSEKSKGRHRGHRHGERVAHLAASSLIVAAALSGTARPALASDWEQIGLDSRPGWVSTAAERRLRLLSGLPAIEDTLAAHAKAYLGDAGPGLAVGPVLDDGLFCRPAC